MFHAGYLGNVGLRGQADHDVQFLQFHIDRVVVLDKEHLDLLLQDLRPAHMNTSRIRLWEQLIQKKQVTKGFGCDYTEEDIVVLLI